MYFSYSYESFQPFFFLGKWTKIKYLVHTRYFLCVKCSRSVRDHLVHSKFLQPSITKMAGRIAKWTTRHPRTLGLSQITARTLVYIFAQMVLDTPGLISSLRQILNDPKMTLKKTLKNYKVNATPYIHYSYPLSPKLQSVFKLQAILRKVHQLNDSR